MPGPLAVAGGVCLCAASALKGLCLQTPGRVMHIHER